MPATKDAFAVVDAKTGQHCMHVVDAADPTDPAWNPPGCVRIHIHPDHYNAMSHDDLHAHVAAKFATLTAL